MANGTLAASQIEMLSQSGTGIITIAPPATNTNRTLTLPDSTTTVVGTDATQTLTNKTLTSPTLTTPNVNSAQVDTVSGTAPLYFARAWVNFNGTGTVAIRASGNVSSITDNGVGDYTVNFTTAMPDANYSALMTSVNREPSSNTNQSHGYYSSSDNITPATYTTSAIRISTGKIAGSGTFVDMVTVSVAIFR